MSPVKLAAACLLAFLALGAAGCGGSSGPSEAEQQAAQRWRAGFSRWGNDMLTALNGISVLFSNATHVDRLQRGDARTTARLAALEQRLATCGDRIRGLGVAPDELTAAREEALRECDSLYQ